MKPKVAVFDLASCEGCELQIANLEEDVVELVEKLDIVAFREVMKEHSDKYDIAFVEGSIQRPIDEERLKTIRKNAGILIAYGDCAGTGGMNKLRNCQPHQEVMDEVYGIARPEDIEGNPFFTVNPTKALDEVVDVDFYIRGCPVRKEQVLYYIRRFLTMPPHKNVDPRYGITTRSFPIDKRSLVKYNPNKCILCRRCDTICRGALGVDALGVVEKGPEVIISTPRNIGLDANGCIHCGQCVSACSVGALETESQAESLRKELAKGTKNFTLVMDSVALASFVERHPYLMALEPGLAEKLVSGALRELGFSEIIQYEHYLAQSMKKDAATSTGKPALMSWCKAALNYAENRLDDLELAWQEENAPWSLLAKDFQDKDREVCLLSPCTALKAVEKLSYVISAMELDELFKKAEMDLEFVKAAEQPYDGTVVPREACHPGVGQLATSFEGRPINSARISPDTRETITGIETPGLVELYPCLRRCLNGGGCYPTVENEIISIRRSWLSRLWGGKE